MSVVIPTTSELSALITSQIEAKISDTVPLLPKAFVRVLAWVLAGVAVVLYKYSGFIFLQLFPRTSSFNETTVNGKKIRPLVEWGRWVGEGDPDEGETAQLSLSLPVLVQSGSIGAGRLFYCPTNGVTYSVMAEVALNAATVLVNLRAVADQSGGNGSGAIGNLPNGTIVRLAEPLANVSREGTVASTVVTGTAPEKEESYRTRVTLRAQRRPRGGASADYWIWGRAAAGVIDIFPYPANTPGQVDLFVETTTEPDGLASGPQLTDVLQKVMFDLDGKATRKPVTAAVNTYSIARSSFDFEITNLTPSSVATQTAISEGLDQWLRTREPFIDGLTVFPRKNTFTAPECAAVASGIATANGANFTDMKMKKAGLYLNAYTLEKGEKAKLGAVTYP